MPDKEFALAVPQALVDESRRRLQAAGVSDPDALLEAALRASAIDRLEIVGGIGPVPTALSDVRAAWLFELSKLRADILPDEVVAVLLRVMPTTAGGVTRRMQATYEAALHESLKAHMVAVGKLSSPQKEPGGKPKHKVTFATAAAYAHAVKTIAAAGLTGEVVASPATRSLEFPQEVEVATDGGTSKVRIAADVLGIG